MRALASLLPTLSELTALGCPGTELQLQLCPCVRMPARPNLPSGIPTNKAKEISRLSSSVDLQFKKSPPKIPYTKTIRLATVLCLIGAFLIILRSLLLAGCISKGGVAAHS